MNFSALGAIVNKDLVGSLVDGFDIIAAKNDGLNCPVCVLDIVDL